MKLKLHLCDNVEKSLFDNLEHELNNVFPFNFEVLLEDTFSYDIKNPKDLVFCAEEELFQYDSISIFSDSFFNLTKITQRYPKEGVDSAKYI